MHHISFTCYDYLIDESWRMFLAKEEQTYPKTVTLFFVTLFVVEEFFLLRSKLFHIFRAPVGL